MDLLVQGPDGIAGPTVCENRLLMEIGGSGQDGATSDTFRFQPLLVCVSILGVRCLRVSPLLGGFVICGSDHADMIFSSCEVHSDLNVPLNKIFSVEFGETSKHSTEDSIRGGRHRDCKGRGK
jgi:hypothetical protein